MKSNKNNVWIPILCNAVILVIFLLIAYPTYTNDLDVMMQAGLYGVGNGVKTAHILFSNVLIGVLLKILCTVAPKIAWYTVFLYVINFLSLTQIGVAFLKDRVNKTSVILYNVLVVFLGFECYMRPGYLKTAALLATVGVYSLYSILRSGEICIFQSILVILELTVASMISWRATLISVIIAGVGLFLFILLRDAKLLKEISFWAHLSVVLVLSVLLAVGFKKYDDTQYKEDQYQMASEYRSAVERLTSFEYIAYSDDMLDELDLEKETHYHHIMNGVYISKDNKALDITKKLASMKREINGTNILGYFRTIPISLFYVGMFYCWLILFVFIAVSQRKNKKKVLIGAILQLILSILVLYFMNLWGRQPAEIVALMPLCLSLFMVCDDITFEDTKTVGVYLLVMAVILYGKFSHYVVTNVTENTMAEEWDAYYLYDEENVRKKDKPDEQELIAGVDAGGDEVKYDNRVHLVNMNEFLKKFSAFTVYTPALCEQHPMIVANGAYGMYSGFAAYTNLPTVTENDKYPWILGDEKAWKTLINYDKQEE